MSTSNLVVVVLLLGFVFGGILCAGRIPKEVVTPATPPPPPPACVPVSELPMCGEELAGAVVAVSRPGTAVCVALDDAVYAWLNVDRLRETR